MATVRQSGLVEFHEYLRKHLHDPRPHRTPENLLEEWRMQRGDIAPDDRDRLAVRAALRDMRNGDRGIDFDVHIQELNRRVQE